MSDRDRLPGGPELVFLSRDPEEHHQMVLAAGRSARDALQAEGAGETAEVRRRLEDRHAIAGLEKVVARLLGRRARRRS